MKILIDLTALADNFSGIERYAICISYEMILQSEDKYILLFKGKVHPIFEKFQNNNRVELVVLSPCKKLLFNQVRLPKEIYKHKADWYLFLAFPVPVLLFKRNMVSTIHDICCWDCPETMNGMSKWYFKISHRVALKKCRKIITISKFSKRRIVEKLHYPKEKVLLIYCGISNNFHIQEYGNCKLKEIQEKYHLPEKYILSLSTLEPRKNLELLIAAFRELCLEQKMDVPLVLAGRKGWKIDSLLKSVEDTVKEKICFTGFIDNEDLPVLYHGAKCFVFPSKYEGFGIPPLEAMACGVSVLSSDSSSLPEVLGNAALYFKSEDQKDLTKKLVEISEMNESIHGKMLQLGRYQAAKFNWRNEAKKLLKELQ